MIKINLLPVRRRRAEEIIRRQVSMFLLVIVVSVGIMGYFHMVHSGEIDRLTNERNRINQEINRHRGRQREIKEYEKKKKILEQKLAIIESLRQNRDLLVHVLDELASIVPADKMWLRKLHQQGDTLTIEGVARGNETIAQFMENLAKSPYIDPNRVELRQSRQEVIQGYKLKAFQLVCRITAPKPKGAEEADTKTKAKPKAKGSS